MNHKQLKMDQVGILAFYYSIFKVNVWHLLLFCDIVTSNLFIENVTYYDKKGNTSRDKKRDEKTYSDNKANKEDSIFKRSF